MVDVCGGIDGEEGEKNNGSQLWVREGRRWKRCGKVFFFPFLYLFSSFFISLLAYVFLKLTPLMFFLLFFFSPSRFFFMFIYIVKGFCQKKIIILEDSILSPYWIRFFFVFYSFSNPVLILYLFIIIFHLLVFHFSSLHVISLSKFFIFLFTIYCF